MLTVQELTDRLACLTDKEMDVYVGPPGDRHGVERITIQDDVVVIHPDAMDKVWRDAVAEKVIQALDLSPLSKVEQLEVLVWVRNIIAARPLLVVTED